MNEIHLPNAKPGDVIVSPAGHHWTLLNNEYAGIRTFMLGKNEALVRTDGSRIPSWTERVERDGVPIWTRPEDQ